MNWGFLTEQKRRLDQFRPLPEALVTNLENWFKVELTYTSNALEGNTLTRQETAVVVEKGLTIGGKSLVEHLEATNHAAALGKVVEIAQSETARVTEHTVLDLHSTILRGIDDANAGRYRSIGVRISGSMVVLPNPAKVPTLMADFLRQMGERTDLHPAELAAEAHYQLVTIHPFIDGNGRTARLLMNLILLQNGYPPALIRKRDRVSYLRSLEKAQLGGSKEDYYAIIAKGVSRSFDIYFKALSPDENRCKRRGRSCASDNYPNSLGKPNLRSDTGWRQACSTTQKQPKPVINSSSRKWSSGSKKSAYFKANASRWLRFEKTHRSFCRLMDASAPPPAPSICLVNWRQAAFPSRINQSGSNLFNQKLN
jgi:fido (protein-threonine AMPylation protein)